MSESKPSTAQQLKNKASRLLIKLLMVGCLFLIIVVVSFAAGFLVYKYYFEKEPATVTNDDSSCSYGGVEYSDGARFDADDGCNSCTCENGTVACTEIACISPTPTTTSTMNPDNYYEKSEFPQVYYEREGLIDNAVKNQFKNKLIDPMTDYYKDGTEGHLIAIVIEVPENVGEEYIISNYFLEGYHGGFLHSLRGDAIDWWVPTCMDECPFSDEFEDKYPEIVDLSNGSF